MGTGGDEEEEGLWLCRREGDGSAEEVDDGDLLDLLGRSRTGACARAVKGGGATGARLGDGAAARKGRKEGEKGDRRGSRGRVALPCLRDLLQALSVGDGRREWLARGMGEACWDEGRRELLCKPDGQKRRARRAGYS